MLCFAYFGATDRIISINELADPNTPKVILSHIQIYQLAYDEKYGLTAKSKGRHDWLQDYFDLYHLLIF
jgi:hypothetical protein